MQLFTHLLSSYLQGMGDFFSALPRGRKKPKQRPHSSLIQEKERNYNVLKHSENELPSLGEG